MAISRLLSEAKIGTGEGSATPHIARTKEPRSTGLHPYSPLSLHEKHIRLLQLDPGDSAAPLSGQIKDVDLDRSAGKYDAVSYTWALEDGDFSLTSDIVITTSQSNIKISRSCENTLRLLRDRTKTRTLWIDMVCIDQRNVKERNQQVREMGSIYSSSNRVFIDVGTDPAGVEVFEYLSLPRATFVKRYGRATARVEAFRILFNRRWFHRIWVLQEVSLARDATIFCGPVSVPWSWLHRYLDGYIHEMDMSSSMTHSLLEKIRPPACAVYMVLRNNPNPTLFDLLVAARPCGSFDPRDKVYALFGLLAPSEVPFVPDYDEPYELIYTKVAAWIIHRTENLQILRHIQPRFSRLLPSWTPNWSEPVCQEWVDIPPLNRNNNETEHESLDSGLRVGNPWSTKLHDQSLQRPKRTNTHASLFESYDTFDGSAMISPILNVYACRMATIWTHDRPEHGQLEIEPEAGVEEKHSSFTTREQELFWRVSSAFASFHGMPIPSIFRAGFRAELLKERTTVANPYDRLKADIAAYSKDLAGFVTASSVGFGPMDIQCGDAVWQIQGVDRWFILREVSKRFTLVGPCYYFHTAHEREQWQTISLE